MRPSDYDIHHPGDEWREHQYETVQWCERLLNKSTSVIQASTGSGKTDFAIAMARRNKSIVLTETKSLQRQYGSDAYKAAVVTGRGNWPCVHPDGLFKDATAADCVYADQLGGMNNCRYRCPYFEQLIAAKKSKKAALNYAYWFLASGHWSSDYLFLDEAHRLPEIVLEFVSCTVNEFHIKRYNLPPAPAISMQMPRRVRLNLATDWLDEVLQIVGKELIKLRDLYKDLPKKYSRSVKAVEQLYERVSFVFKYISTDSDEDWYIGSQPDRFVAKPLTAKHNFPDYFLGKRATVLQSATIGNPSILAKELGIETFKYRNVPSRFTPEQRKVYLLDCPRMGMASVNKNPEFVNHQADAITKFVKDYDESWHWLIHAQSKAKIYKLEENLSLRGLADRVWVVPEVPTDDQTAAWETRRKTPGAIILSWSWSEGVDLPEVNGCIVADIPFAYLGDDYIRARMRAYPQMYRQSAAWEVEQRAGRTRRGVAAHYNIDGAEPKAVGIADGNYSMLMKYYSDEFVESLEER